MSLTTLPGAANLCDMTPAEANEINRRLDAYPDLLAACQAAKKYLEPDLVEPGRTVFWKLVAAIEKAVPIAHSPPGERETP